MDTIESVFSPLTTGRGRHPARPPVVRPPQARPTSTATARTASPGRRARSLTTLTRRAASGGTQCTRTTRTDSRRPGRGCRSRPALATRDPSSRDQQHKGTSDNGSLYLRARQRSPYALEALTVKLDRSALGACWRWRTELLIVLVLAAASVWLWLVLGSWPWSLAVLGGLVLVLAAVPWPRRFIIAWFWALFTRHRLQRAFWELRLHTRAGRLPLIAWIDRDPGRLPRPGDLPRGPVLRGLRGQRS